MRILSPALQTTLSQRLGLEPMMIVGVTWDGVNEVLYAEKTITGRPQQFTSPGHPFDPAVGGLVGKLLEISGIDDVTNVSGSGSSGTVTIKLDDTDGTIKSIIDKRDVHKQIVAVYQAFIEHTDTFLIYQGEINTPIEWNEGDRTFSFSAVTIIEDLEVGFSAEEGEFPNLPDAAIGVPWPMCFGTPKHVPGLTFQQVPIGQIMTNILVPDRTLTLSLQYMTQAAQTAQENIGLDSFYLALAAYNGDWDTERYYKQKLIEHQEQLLAVNKDAQQAMTDRLNKMLQYQTDTANLLSQQIGPVTQGYTVISNNARYFPIGKTIICKCGDFLLQGVINADSTFTFTILQPPIPRIQPWADPPDPTTGLTNSGIGWIVPAWSEADMYVGPDNEIQPIYNGTPGFGPHQIRLDSGYRFQDSIDPEGIRIIPAGSSIQIVSDIDMEYIFNIAPTVSVDTVWAYRYQGNVRSLNVVPTSYYTVIERSYVPTEGGLSPPFTATSIVLKRPLTGYAFEGWEDPIYADLTCEVVGIDDILRYLIAQYTNKQIDESSWSPGGTPLDDCSFYLAKRGNILSVLAEMAYQTRHAIFIKNGKFGLTYLPIKPTSDYTITEDDIEAGTLDVTCTPTEEIITKIKASFFTDYALPGESKVIVKAGDRVYGLREHDDNYYVYTFTESVMKSTTFWIIRKSIAWKMVKFRTFLKHLALESFDAVNLAFTNPWVCDSNVLGIIESCVYNAVDNNVEISMWLPVPFGSLTEHPMAWPGSAEEGQVWNPYVAIGVEPQPKPAFYAGAIRGFVPLVLGDSTTIPAKFTSPADTDHTEAKDDSLTDDGGDASDDNNPQPWQPAPPTAATPPRRLAVDRYNYDDIFKKPDPKDPGPALLSCVPAQIVTYDTDTNTYGVTAYPFGLDGKAYNVTGVKVLQVAPDMWFPKLTWVLLNKIWDKDNKSHFYMQPPVWLA